MAIPQRAILDAQAAQARVGVSDLAAALALAVAGPESGWDPGALGDYMLNGVLVDRDTPGEIPTSFGYAQLHTDAGGDGGGVGNGHSQAELLDGVSNFAIAMAEIQRRLNAGADAWGALAPWSARGEAMGLLGEASAALGSISPEMPLHVDVGIDGAAVALLALLGLGAMVLVVG